MVGERVVRDLDSLAVYFASLRDQRCARGKRYRLAQICILATLAKLSGEDQPSAIAQWAQLRHAVLGPLLGLPKRLPCHNLERRSVNTLTGEVRHEVVYGLTSLTAQEASPKRLLGLIRQYWGIENGLH